MTVLGAPEAAVDRTRRLAGLWRAALEIDADGDTAGSFFELGGYSLLALSLAERIGRDAPVEESRVRRALATLRGVLAPVATGVAAGATTGAQAWALAAIGGLTGIG